MAWSLHLGQRLIQTLEVDLGGLGEELQGLGYPECGVCGGVQAPGGMSLGLQWEALGPGPGRCLSLQWGLIRRRSPPCSPPHPQKNTVLLSSCFSVVTNQTLLFLPCSLSFLPSQRTHRHRVITSHVLCGVGQVRVTLHLTPRKHAEKQLAYLKKTVGSIPVLEKCKQLE